MDRKFFIRAKDSRRCYCSNCGGVQLQDRYNFKKHGKSCGFTEEDCYEPVQEEETYGYRWKKEEGKLIFEICFPQLFLRPGFADRYTGGGWKPVFAAALLPASREVKTLFNETDAGFDEWIKRITEKKLVRIQKEKDLKVIQSVFPGILGIWSYEMFAEIYRKKGYRYVPLLKAEMARQLVGQGIRDVKEKERETSGEIKDGQLHCRAVLFKEKTTGARILRLITESEEGIEGFLFSGDCYVYSYRSDPGILKLFWRRMSMDEKSRQAVLRFAKAYPGCHLKEYLQADENGNILIPLLAADYHLVYELLAKAGLANIACHPRLNEYILPPEKIGNLKEVFGVPVSVLRRLHTKAVNPGNLRTVRLVYENDPSYLDHTCLLDSMIQLLRDVGPEHQLHQHRNDGWEDGLTKQQIRRMMCYLQVHPEIRYSLYRDYLNLRHYENNDDYGLTPENLARAHDALTALHQERSSLEQKERFLLQLCRPEYQRLATDATEDDEELFGEDPFFIMLPSKSEDLYMEGQSMHNCVRIYTDAVCRGTTQILFLRKKEDPDRSFGTIEVSAGKSLIQAKGFANKHLTKNAQLFVRKWAKAKKLRLSTRDLSETAGEA